MFLHFPKFVPLHCRLVKAHDNYFVQQTDALGRFGLSTLQKAPTTFWVLAYGIPADSIDEYVKIDE